MEQICFSFHGKYDDIKYKRSNLETIWGNYRICLLYL